MAEDTTRTSNRRLNSGASEYNAISFMVEQQMKGGINTCIPVRVDSCTKPGPNGAAGYVSATPLVMQRGADGNSLAPVSLPQLPFFRLYAGTAAVVIDPQPGDVGLAIFSQQDASNLEAGKNEPVQAGSFRSFDMSDGFYIGGFLGVPPDVYAELLSSDDPEQFAGIHLTTPTNVITIGRDDGTITIKANTEVKVDAPIAKCTGDVEIAGTLKTGGLATFQQGLQTATGTNATIGGSLTAAHDISAGGDFSGSGGISLSGGASFGGPMDVTGAATFGGTLDTTGAATFGGTLDATGAATFSNTITANGAATFGSTLSTTGAATFGSTITATGSATFNNTLDVAGALTADSLTTGNISADGDITLAGDTITLDGDVTVTGNLEANNITADGTISGDISGAGTINGNLSVTGYVSAGGSLSAASLSIGASATITNSGWITVPGVTTRQINSTESSPTVLELNSNVYVNENLEVRGNLTADNDIKYGGQLTPI